MDPIKEPLKVEVTYNKDSLEIKDREVVIKQLAIEQRIKNKPIYRCFFD